MAKPPKPLTKPQAAGKYVKKTFAPRAEGAAAPEGKKPFGGPPFAAKPKAAGPASKYPTAKRPAPKAAKAAPKVIEAAPEPEELAELPAFSDLALSEPLARAIADLGFECQNSAGCPMGVRTSI